MSNPVILAAKRTPIGKFQGQFAKLSAVNLAAEAAGAAIRQSRVPVDQVEEAIFGMVLPAGVGQAPARQVAIAAGLPPTVAALTVNKVCGSGLKAVMLAAQAVRCGDAEVVLAGGMESMSRAPWLVERQVQGLGDQKLIDSMTHDGLSCSISQLSMGSIAEQLSRQRGITRADQDAFACESHHRAINAQSGRQFDAELVPITISAKSGSVVIDRDEGPRAECSLEGLAKLRPAFSGDGVVTAGNAAMISDGAAAVVVASSQFAQNRGLKPLAEIVAYATAGLPPEDLFVAPVEAIRKVLAKSSLQVGDIDRWEINEAFAVQMLACQRMLDIPGDQLNTVGGAIALGHPIGASGARVLTTLVHSLHRDNVEWGIAALCLGGGNAVAMVVRRV